MRRQQLRFGDDRQTSTVALEDAREFVIREDDPSDRPYPHGMPVPRSSRIDRTVSAGPEPPTASRRSSRLREPHLAEVDERDAATALRAPRRSASSVTIAGIDEYPSEPASGCVFCVFERSLGKLGSGLRRPCRNRISPSRTFSGLGMGRRVGRASRPTANGRCGTHATFGSTTAFLQLRMRRRCTSRPKYGDVETCRAHVPAGPLR